MSDPDREALSPYHCAMILIVAFIVYTVVCVIEGVPHAAGP